MDLKKFIRLIPFYLPFVLIMVSCTEDINLDYLRPDPKLVISAFLPAEEPVAIKVSHTWFFTDPEPDMRKTNVKVDLFVNDEFRETLICRENYSQNNKMAYYEGAYKPRSGDKIRIEASAAGFPEANATTTIPFPAEIISFKSIEHKDSVLIPGYLTVNVYWNYQVELRDRPNEPNYYFLSFEAISPVWDGENQNYYPDSVFTYIESIDYTSDPVFSQQQSAIDKILGYEHPTWHKIPFPDYLFADKTYQFNINKSGYMQYHPTEDNNNPYPPGYGSISENQPPIPDVKKQVIIQTISAEYYNYNLSVRSKNSLTGDLVEIGLAEPMRTYSNVQGGAGILGASCSALRQSEP